MIDMASTKQLKAKKTTTPTLSKMRGIGLFLQVYLAMAGLLFMMCKAEEKSMLEGASVVQYNYSALSYGPDALIDGNFNTYQQSQKGTRNNPETGNYIAIVLPKERQVRTVLIANRGPAEYDKLMGELMIGVGTSVATAQSNIVQQAIYASGFFTVDPVAAEGTTILFEQSQLHAGSTSYDRSYLILNEVRLYEMPNLLQQTGITAAAVTADSSAP